MVEYQLNSKSHPEQVYRTCLGLLSLARKYGEARLEQASKDALVRQEEQLTTYAELSFNERLSLLLEYEILSRNVNKVGRLKRQAKLLLSASPNQLDYRVERGLNRKLMGGYQHNCQNILLTGPIGAGKTYVACALAEQACEQQHLTRYYRLSRLLDDLSAARINGTYQKVLLNLAKKIIGDR